MDMMYQLREVNVDNNRVGWYQSMFLGTFSNQLLIQALQSYHESIPNSVVILYDPVQTANGNLTIRAFRLSDEYLEVAKRGTNEFLPSSKILEELPVKIRNPGLVNALLFDLKDSVGPTNDFEHLDLTTNPYLEKNLEFLCIWVDGLAKEQYDTAQAVKRDRWNRKQQQNDGNAVDEFQAPERISTLLAARQIDEYCSQVHRFTGASFGKLFLAGSLQKDS